MSPELETLFHWTQTCLIIAAITTTAFPVLYAFSPWYKSKLGRIVMAQSLAFAVAIDMTTIFQFWVPSSMRLILWLNALVFSSIAAASTALTWKLWKLNYKKKAGMTVMSHVAPEPPTETHPIMSNSTYNQLKWFTMIVLPALGTLYFVLAPLWNLPKGAEVSASITGLVTFFGLILGVSTRAYNLSQEKFDGHITVTENEDGVPVATMQLKNYEDPAAVVNQETLLFKVNK